ncbi:MAG TPA: hypothetical protein VFH92_10410 [Phenylobacterium sp.]|nr:hypothetical protein [Phenylobacterium sp.]
MRMSAIYRDVAERRRDAAQARGDSVVDPVAETFQRLATITEAEEELQILDRRDRLRGRYEP